MVCMLLLCTRLHHYMKGKYACYLCDIATLDPRYKSVEIWIVRKQDVYEMGLRTSLLFKYRKYCCADLVHTSVTATN